MLSLGRSGAPQSAPRRAARLAASPVVPCPQDGGCLRATLTRPLTRAFVTNRYAAICARHDVPIRHSDNAATAVSEMFQYMFENNDPARWREMQHDM